MKWMLACLLLLPLKARGAAWTQGAGQWQVIGSAISSDAQHGYDGQGRAVTPKLFQRMLLQTDMAYGWNDELTLLLRTETAYARIRDNDGPLVTAVDNAFEAGARYRLVRGLGLLADDDVLSLEATARMAGAFNFAVSSNAAAAGQDGGIRLLYGAGFQAFARDGFVNAELGHRWVSHPRPNQTPIDLTVGLWLSPDWMAMAQSFNLISGPARLPYQQFRIHKMQFSAVWKFSPNFSVQSGLFFSPAGRNALDERGLVVSLWAAF